MGDGGEQSTLIAEDWGYLNSPLGKNIAVASTQWLFIFPDFTISKYCFCFSSNVPLGFPIPFFQKSLQLFLFSFLVLSIFTFCKFIQLSKDCSLVVANICLPFPIFGADQKLEVPDTGPLFLLLRLGNLNNGTGGRDRALRK